MQVEPKIRIFLEGPIKPHREIDLSQDQGHYLRRVMRKKSGEIIRVFNGFDGEFAAKILPDTKKTLTVEVQDQLRSPEANPDIWLLFAPLKKDRTNYLIEKGTELGVSRFMPIRTEYTNSERIKIARLAVIAREATEQSEGFDPPPIDPLARLSDLLQNWPDDRCLIFCDEAQDAGPSWPEVDQKSALLIGPEGGFSRAERNQLRELPFVRPLSLGRKILRAETAAIVALAGWHDRHRDQIKITPS